MDTKDDLRPALQAICLLLVIILVGCSTPITPGPTSLATVTPGLDDTEEPLPVTSSPAVTEAAPTITPSIPPSPSPTSPGDVALPLDETLSFTVVAQFGGVPHALAVEGSTAYVGFGPRLLVIDVRDPANPQLLGQSQLLPDIVYGVDVADGLAYLAAGRGGLIILDVNDPAKPHILNPGPNGIPSARQVTVVDGSAYLVDEKFAEGFIRLLRFDVSDPANVSLLYTYPLGLNETVVVEEDLAIVVGGGRLQLRDPADPDLLLGQVALTSGSYASRAVVLANTITVIESGESSGFEQFDITDPTNPIALGQFQPLDAFITNLAAIDGELLVFHSTFGEFGFCQSDIHVVQLGTSQGATFDPKNCAHALALQGSTLFLTGNSGFQIFDLSDPTRPALQSLFIHPDGFHDVQALAWYEDWTYVISAEGRSFDILTLDLAQPAPEMLMDRLVIGQGALLDLLTMGDTLVAPVWMGGLGTLNLTDPTSPQILHPPSETEFQQGDFPATAQFGEVLYMSVSGSGLVGAVGAVDLSEPGQPTLGAVVETQNSLVLSMAITRETLYVLTQGETNTIHVFDISEPLSPRQVYVIPLAVAANELTVAGDRLYAACDGWNCQSLVGIDILDPHNPEIGRTWPLQFGVQDMVADGQGLIYLVTIEAGVWVLNAADPDDLHLAGHLQLPGRFTHLNVSGDEIFAGALDAGLFVIRVEGVN